MGRDETLKEGEHTRIERSIPRFHGHASMRTVLNATRDRENARPMICLGFVLAPRLFFLVGDVTGGETIIMESSER